MSRAKDKGTWVETQSVRYLAVNGFPAARREVLAGSQDRGDLVLAPGLIAECKWANRGLQLTAWRRELEKEVANAGARTGILIMKPEGAGTKAVHRFIGGIGGEAYIQLRGAVMPRFRTGISDGDLGPVYGAPHRIYAHAAKVNTYLREVAKANLVPVTPGGTLLAHMMPFASVVRPGGEPLDEADNVVIGPLWQFVVLLRAAGFGEAL